MSRFRGKLVKMIKDTGSKYHGYSISSKIRHILLHWSYELSKKDFLLIFQTNIQKINYYWFNRQKILQKAENYAQN